VIARALTSPAARALFRRHTILVASTGNLGMAVGLAASALGFTFEVHMSADAKAWKKSRLREAGAVLVEYKEDYSTAVKGARTRLMEDQTGLKHFVDDENSKELMKGYSVGALRLQRQLAEQKIRVDRKHPLILYIPSGVGGAPSGVMAGLHHLFGKDMLGFITEPTTFPSCLIAAKAGCGRATPDEALGACPTGISAYIAPERCSTIADGPFPIRSFTADIPPCFCVFQGSRAPMRPSSPPACCAAQHVPS